jgi:tetratricopeptide (TPR) repeat protein
MSTIAPPIGNVRKSTIPDPTPLASFRFPIIRNLLLRISIVLILSFGMGGAMDLRSSDASDKIWIDVLQKTDIINNEIMMKFLEAINYKQFDITRYLNDQNKYDNNLLYWLALENMGVGQLREAETLIDAILNADETMNNRSEAYKSQGDIKILLKKTEEAMIAFENALAYGNKKVYPMLGLSYVLTNQDAKFEQILSELMKLKKQDTNALEALIAYSVKKRDAKLFKNIISELDNSQLACKETILSNAIGMLRMTGEKEDVSRADTLQKILTQSKLNSEKAFKVQN